MGFIIFRPLADQFEVKESTQSVVEQTWQEFEILQIMAGTSTSFGPFIDQAKHYFNDALKSHWRTAALLYYYSFMNLGKGFLILKSRREYTDLVSKKVRHGLLQKTQLPAGMYNFEIEILPASTTMTTIEIFPEIYEAVTSNAWPFESKVTIKMSEILPYCVHIGDEVKRLYGVQTMLGLVQSLMRSEGSDQNAVFWFEALTDGETATRLQSIPGWSVQRLDSTQFTHADRNDWLLSLRRTASSLQGHVAIRGPRYSDSEHGTSATAHAARDAISHFKGYAYPVMYNLDNPGWYFVPEITIEGRALRWHPLLSDYLFSFALSSIVRYSPQLVEPGKPDFFVANAWCAQSPIVGLKYFLCLSTNPSVIVYQIQ